MKVFFKFLIILISASYFSSCSDYLNIVPDNTLTIENIFSVKEEAYNALAKIYSYLPPIHDQHNSTWILGDEFIGQLDYDLDANRLRGIRIMRGLQSVTSPILGTWSGTTGGGKFYEAIRQTNVFIDNIDKVANMSDFERADWKAQAKFLKAYYNFLLIQQYGPIVIVDKQINPDAIANELFMYRSKVDECFNYVINLMDEAIPHLKERANANDYGTIDQIGAKAVKARVLLFRASPFYNGNREYYEDFLDHRQEPFFPLIYDKEKWKDAIDAIDEAIELSEANQKGLYTYEKEIYTYDREDFSLNEDMMNTLYNLRMLIVDAWNKELLWGFSNFNFSNCNGLQQVTNIRLPPGYYEGVVEETACSGQWMAATYAMAERYYTKNGLPIDEDLTFDMNTKHDIITLPGIEENEYQQYRGYLQPGVETIKLYLDREPRFYANLGITGGYWRSHITRINTLMFDNQDGGRTSVSSTNYLCTGIGIQKFAHPETASGKWTRQIRYPYPIIRLADLYLMKAEAYNEYYGPSQKVYDALNLLRNRAGVPDIESAWSIDQHLARNAGKHLTQEGLRDIILRERSIELAFEGSHFWDMVRHKRASSEFSSPIFGWNYAGSNAKDFFVLDVKQSRKFTITDCLWPIDLNEMNTNSNLIQNPGW